jgi:drug/metabolite transporter (DMT)-like permease
MQAEALALLSAMGWAGDAILVRKGARHGNIAAAVRFLCYTGIVRLGASRAGPLRGMTPLFAVAIAYVALRERLGWALYLASF